MFESKTADVIKQNILTGITSGLNTLEGGIVHDIVSPVSIEMEQNYIDMDFLLKIVFANTSYGEFLDMRVNEFGIYRKDGVKASGNVVFTGIVDTVILKNTVVQTSEGLLFRTSAEAVVGEGGSVVVNVVADDIGELYNVDINKINIIPISIVGITSVTNNVPFTNGASMESDESLLSRYNEKIKNPMTSGNLSAYKQWALEVDEVGGALAYVEDVEGVNVIKVKIVNRNKGVADTTLITAVSSYIEEHRPVGAVVEVSTLTEIYLNITANVEVVEGADTNAINTAFNEAIENYFKEATLKYDDVSHAKIGAILMGIDGVLDYTSLCMNESEGNIPINTTFIPVVESVEFTFI